MGIDNAIVVGASAVCTDTTINHGYRYPIKKSILAERAGLRQSYYVCTYKLHKLHNNRREITYNNNGGVYGEGWSFTVSADRLDVFEVYIIYIQTKYCNKLVSVYYVEQRTCVGHGMATIAMRCCIDIMRCLVIGDMQL